MSGAIDIERAVLGAVLRGEVEAFETARVAGLTAETFFHDAHRAIWQAAEKVDKATGRVDVTAVLAVLRESKVESDFLGPIYLLELVDQAGTSTNIEAYARELIGVAVRRFAIAELAALQRRLSSQEAFAKDDVALIANAFTRILSADPASPDARPVPAVANELLEVLQSRVRDFRAGTLRGMSTGLPLLDSILGGWIAGRLYVVAARPSIGKTTLAVNFADAVKDPWAFFTLEMLEPDILEKLVSKRAEIVGSKMQSGDLSNNECDKLADVIQQLASSRAFIDSRSGRFIETFEVAVRRLVRREGVRVVFLDYLQQMRARGRWASRQAELTEITDRVKQLALETGVAIVANAQLSREAEKADVPMMSHLKESGSIEQDADAVLFLYRPKDEPLTLVVGKNRWGRKGRVVLDDELALNKIYQATNMKQGDIA